MLALHQITAILKGAKSRAYAAVTELHKATQKAEPFNGQERTYRPVEDGGETLPPESKKVLLNYKKVLDQVAEIQAETFDLTLRQEDANTRARGDIVVDGVSVLENVPVTFMIYLEKQLNDVRTFVDKLPVLDDAKTWTHDPATGNYRTEKVSTHRTKKVQKAIVLYHATPEHPAQTQLITEDVIAGWWDTVYHSGAIPQPEKDKVLRRVDRLITAVKSARQLANATHANESLKAGEAVFGYLFQT